MSAVFKIALRDLAAVGRRRHAVPLQEQLYQRVRTAIADGKLRPGERLPAARTLASELGIARGTVDAAYARLAGEGYVIARRPTGTVVSPALHLASPTSRPSPPRMAAPPAAATTSGEPRLFQMGLPALDLFPRTLWARLTARAARRMSGAALAYPDSVGLPALREALVSYLAVSRGVLCDPAQVMITGGYQPAISLLAQLLLRPGDAVWFEEPGYFLARQALQAASARLVPVPVDGEGMRVEAAAGRAPKAQLAVVTPAHQSPLGVALALARRQALLAWASSSGGWIVEDDYDSEFHYVGRRLPALKSLDVADRVIYAGSFSKTLFPSLRLGYLVVPRPLVGTVGEAMRGTAHGQPFLGQIVVADFISEGHFARHLKRMRGRYAARREAFARALDDTFGERIDVALQPGGMYVLARFAGQGPDTELLRRARENGLAPTALSDHYIGRRREHGLLLGFTNIPEARAAAAAQALRCAIG